MTLHIQLNKEILIISSHKLNIIYMAEATPIMIAISGTVPLVSSDTQIDQQLTWHTKVGHHTVRI